MSDYLTVVRACTADLTVSVKLIDTCTAPARYEKIRTDEVHQDRRKVS